MEIAVCSDIHLESNHITELDFDRHVDVLVLAGDVCEYRNIQKFDAFFRNISIDVEHIIYVPGNHEYYFNNINTDIPDTIQRKYPNIRLLNNNSTVIDGIKFVGSTLWTDYGGNDVYKIIAKHNLADHTYITYKGALLHPNDCAYFHSCAVDFLEQACDASHPTIVVTHHAPSYLSVHPKFISDRLNPAFCSDMLSFIERKDIMYWIHGHMHNECDYRVGETRIICNPMGYKNENLYHEMKYITV